MTGALHTEGPWIAGLRSDWSVDTDSSNSYIHVGPEGSNPVCIVIQAESWHDEDERLDADANLIAAAPELLAIARRLVKWDKDYPVNCWNGYAGLKEMDVIVADCAKIIAKAEAHRAPANDTPIRHPITGEPI